MPRYDYACKCGVVTEAVRGYETDTISCPCGGRAKRLAVYAYQSIRGETVPKGNATRAGNIKDKHGRTRVSLFQEASQELEHVDQKRADDELPPLPKTYKEGVRRARALEAAGYPAGRPQE